jgi:phosphoribosylglycinamide formyltransferase-1
MTLQLGVLVSGSGSNLQAIIDRIGQGVLDAEIKVVFSNNREAYGLVRAEKHEIPAVALPHAEYPDRSAFDAAMTGVLKDHGVTTVAMAGFMRMVTPEFLAAFPGRVVNIHPSILPSFKGTHGQRDAAEYGVRISGCTVHFVDEGLDTGPIIIQAAVPALAVDGTDSLGARILTLEHRIYPQALQWLSEGRLSVEGRQVFLAPGRRGKAFQGSDCAFLVSPALEEGF